MPSPRLLLQRQTGGGGVWFSYQDGVMVMMMSFICSCRNKKEDLELHIYLEEGTYHKRLFRGPSTNDMKK